MMFSAEAWRKHILRLQHFPATNNRQVGAKLDAAAYYTADPEDAACSAQAMGRIHERQTAVAENEAA
jgi:hypothetical protein